MTTPARSSQQPDDVAQLLLGAYALLPPPLPDVFTFLPPRTAIHPWLFWLLIASLGAFAVLGMLLSSSDPGGFVPGTVFFALIPAGIFVWLRPLSLPLWAAGSLRLEEKHLILANENGSTQQVAYEKIRNISHVYYPGTHGGWYVSYLSILAGGATERASVLQIEEGQVEVDLDKLRWHILQRIPAHKRAYLGRRRFTRTDLKLIVLLLIFLVGSILAGPHSDH